MSKRLIEFILPDSEMSTVKDLFKELDLNVFWLEQVLENKIKVRFLINQDKSEAVLDRIEEKFAQDKGFNLFIFSLEASLPKEQVDDVKGGDDEKHQKKQEETSRISREELYEETEKGAQVNATYIMLIVLSTVIAAVGIAVEETIPIIGAAMIAPLLGPNVAFSLAVVLNDFKLMKKSAVALIVGLGITLILSIIIGIVIKFSFPDDFITSGTIAAGFRTIVVALSAGIAGALAFSTGASSIMVGVVVAVALLPPLVRLGLVIGEEQWASVWQAFLLVMVNLVCINLACVVTFFFQGVRPVYKGQEDGAKKTSVLGITVWLFLLILFAVLIFFSRW